MAIVDYGVGNIENVSRAFRAIGAEVSEVQDADTVHNYSHVVLPGVGRFDYGISGLRTSGFDMALVESARTGNSILGICLGMQLLADASSEGGSEEGLGLLSGFVDSFLPGDSHGPADRVPHSGWSGLDWASSIKDAKGGAPLEDAYFSHSYHLRPGIGTEVLATSQLFALPFVAVARKSNILGAQFHPEKSGKAGLVFLSSWLRGAYANV